MLQLAPNFKFHQFDPAASRFRVTGNFEAGALNDSKMTFNTIRPKGATIWHIMVSLSPKFHAIILYAQPFSSRRPF